MKKPEIKSRYHKALLKRYEYLTQEMKGILISENKSLNGKEIEWKTKVNKFESTFEFDFFSSETSGVEIGQDLGLVKVKFSGVSLELENFILHQYQTPMVKALTTRLRTYGFSEKTEYFFKMLIPLPKEIKFLEQIEQVPFKTDLGYSSRCSTEAIINGETLELYCLKADNKQHYLVIESAVRQTLDQFSTKANSVKIAFGYLTGKLPGNLGVFFAFDQNSAPEPIHFFAVGLRSSISSGYCPLTCNAYSHSRIRAVVEKYHDSLHPVSLAAFSRLSQRIHGSLDFSSALILILESSVASLLFMPGGYAIALESLADIIMAGDRNRISPIKSKQQSKKIRKSLLAVLREYESELEGESMEVLRGRINQINQITNKSRLKAPFEKLGIELDDMDLRILETRNDFLHGRTPNVSDDKGISSVERLNKDLLYCSWHLYTLVNILVLKWVGYKGRVINYPKIQESYTQIQTPGEFYREV